MKPSTANKVVLPESMRKTSLDTVDLGSNNNETNNSKRAKIMENEIRQQIEHDVSLTLMDRADKLSDHIRKSIKVQQICYQTLRTTTDINHRTSMEHKIAILESDIRYNSAMLDQIRSNSVTIQMGLGVLKTTATASFNSCGDDDDNDDSTSMERPWI